MYRIRRCSLPVSELHILSAIHNSGTYSVPGIHAETDKRLILGEEYGQDARAGKSMASLYENRASCTVFNPSFSGAETHILASFPYIRVRDKDKNGYCLRVQTRKRMAFTAIRGRLSCIVECTKKNCMFTVREGERV